MQLYSDYVFLHKKIMEAKFSRTGTTLGRWDPHETHTHRRRMSRLDHRSPDGMSFEGSPASSSLPLAETTFDAAVDISSVARPDESLQNATTSAPRTRAVRSSLATHDWDLILGNRNLDEYERESGNHEDLNHIPTIGALNIDYRMLTRISENELQDVRMLNTQLEPPAVKALVYALVRSKTVYSVTLSGCGLDDR